MAEEFKFKELEKNNRYAIVMLNPDHIIKLKVTNKKPDCPFCEAERIKSRWEILDL